LSLTRFPAEFDHQNPPIVEHIETDVNPPVPEIIAIEANAQLNNLAGPGFDNFDMEANDEPNVAGIGELNGFREQFSPSMMNRIVVGYSTHADIPDNAILCGQENKDAAIHGCPRFHQGNLDFHNTVQPYRKKYRMIPKGKNGQKKHFNASILRHISGPFLMSCDPPPNTPENQQRWLWFELKTHGEARKKVGQTLRDPLPKFMQ
jgi:hypothetical protein